MRKLHKVHERTTQKKQVEKPEEFTVPYKSKKVDKPWECWKSTGGKKNYMLHIVLVLSTEVRVRPK
jgi:hypothetical protein